MKHLSYHTQRILKGLMGFPGGSDGKESVRNAGDLGLIPGLGRFPGEGNGYPLQYSCLKNSIHRRSLAGYSAWNSPGKDTGVGCYFLLQGIFPTQGSNMGLLHCRQILYLLNYKGSSLLCLPPAEFPNPKTELMSPALQADSLPSEPSGKPRR